MITHQHKRKLLAIYSGIVAPLVCAASASADGGGISQAQSFIKSLTGDLALLAGGIAGLFLVFGGLVYASSNNNPERMEGSKRTMLNALIGLVVVIASYSIINFATDLAKSNFGS